MKRIAVVTATRAEYGILYPLIKRIDEDPELILDLLVTGTHLSKKHGMTVKFIEEDGFHISRRIPICVDGNLPYDISVTMANALVGFAAYFKDNRPDILVVLGDRTEILGIAAAAMNERIPIAHIHGGEVTEGAVDDCVRHALTKMSYLHFPSTEKYKNRIIQLGEAPERVFNVGALSTENILSETLLEKNDFCKGLAIPHDKKLATVTFHPVTLETSSAGLQVMELCEAMKKRNDIFFIVTMANTDVGGDLVNKILKSYCDVCENMKFFSSLGMRRYLSAVKYSSFVLGNSSSGLIEAPVLGTPTVNIGDRQKGRLMPESVINCKADRIEIARAIEQAIKMDHKPSYLYGDGHTSIQIIEKLKEFLLENKIDLKKKFYDLSID